MVTDADVVLRSPKTRHAGCARTRRIWVQMSTIGVAGIERVETLVRPNVLTYCLIDARAGQDPAEEGQLTIFASGPKRSVRGSGHFSMRWAGAHLGGTRWDRVSS